MHVPVSWLAGALVFALIAAAELHTAVRGWAQVLPFVLLVPPVLLGAALTARRQVRVEDGVLHVPGARAPLTAFGPPEVVEGPALHRWLGAAGDRDAWVVMRPWLRSAVRLPVVDPTDDTPYWLVGTRRPVALAAALS